MLYPWKVRVRLFGVQSLSWSRIETWEKLHPVWSSKTLPPWHTRRPRKPLLTSPRVSLWRSRSDNIKLSKPCLTKPCKPSSPFVISEIISEICSCVNSIIIHFWKLHYKNNQFGIYKLFETLSSFLPKSNLILAKNAGVTFKLLSPRANGHYSVKNWRG